MKIVWDEKKRLSNLAKHGLDFASLDLFDWGTANITPARAAPSGQQRWKATGVIDDIMVSFIFSFLGREALSIISLRPSNFKERKALEWLRSTRH